MNQDWFSGLGGAHSGWEGPVFTVDNNPRFKSSVCADIMELQPEDFPKEPLILWISFPCETFSVASIGHHWTGGDKGYVPKTAAAVKALKMLRHVIWLISEVGPKYWFLENPRGMLRKMPEMRKFPRVTISQCQYGSNWMKPTDIWGRFPWSWKPRKLCSAGDPCHDPSPRSLKISAVQSERDVAKRALIPKELSGEIWDAVQFSEKCEMPSWRLLWDNSFDE